MFGKTWGLIPVTPSTVKAECYNFKINLGYTVNSRLARATQQKKLGLWPVNVTLSSTTELISGSCRKASVSLLQTRWSCYKGNNKADQHL